MIEITCEQGTPEWFEARCGIPTASNFKKLVSSTGRPSTQQKGYMMDLLAEKMMGEKTHTEPNEWMLRGIELEAEAADLYAFTTGAELKEVGFLLDSSQSFGCSPDRLVGDGGLEIKCPKPSTHVSYLLANKVPADYYPQVQGCMLVTGAKWWDFMSYCPGMKPLIIRCERDEAYLETLCEELSKFHTKLIQNYQQLTQKEAA